MWAALFMLAFDPALQAPAADAPPPEAASSSSTQPAPPAPAPAPAPAEAAEEAEGGIPLPLIIGAAVVGGVVIVGTGALGIWALALGTEAASTAVNDACGSFVGGICQATCLGPVDTFQGCTADFGDCATSGSDSLTSCASCDSLACDAPACEPGASCASPALAREQSRSARAPARAVPSEPGAMRY
jgi:hypothetical protein